MAFQTTDDKPDHFPPLILPESDTQKKFAPISPHPPTKMASESTCEVIHGQSMRHRSCRSAQPRNVLPDLTKILQEREKLRVERGVYLQRTQYLATEQRCFQELLRDLAAAPAFMSNHEEIQQARQLLERIESALVFFQQADARAKTRLLGLQQEALLLGHPPPHQPWASEADILLPHQEEEKERQQRELVPPSCGSLPQPRPQPRPQEPPRRDPQPPPVATVRTQSGREMDSISIAKSSDEVKDATVKSLIETIHGSMAVDLGQDECGEAASARAGTHQSSAPPQAAPEGSTLAMDCHPGSSKATAEASKQKQKFSVENVLRKATMLVGDKVQSKISTKPDTPSEQAADTKTPSDTFQKTDMEERCELQEPAGRAQPSAVGPDAPQGMTSGLMEGTILRVPQKQPPSASNVALSSSKDRHLGSLKAVQGRLKKILSFCTDDVVTRATMLVGDKVQFKFFIDPKTKAERAVNVEILPDTFECKTEEQRKTGVVLGLCNSFGYIKCCQDPKLVFDLCEVMEEEQLSMSEKVEFTIVPNIAAGTGNQAVRIRRLRVSTPLPNLDGSTTGHTAKITTLTKTKEKMQKDAKVTSDDYETETHVQSLPESVGPIKTTKREQIPDTKTRTPDTKTKNTQISVNKGTVQRYDHGNLGTNRRLSHRRSSKEGRQEGVSKACSTRGRRIGSTGHKSTRSLSRSRSRSRERRRGAGQGREGKRRGRSREKWDGRRMLRRSIERSYSSHSWSTEYSYSSRGSSRSSRSRSRSRSWGRSVRTGRHRSRRSSSRHRERRNRGMRRSRESFQRRNQSSSRERSREGNIENSKDQDRSGLQRWSHSPDRRNERRRNSSGECSSRKRRPSSARAQSPTAKLRKMSPVSTTSDTNSSRTPETDPVQNEGAKASVEKEKEKEMELEELEALIAKRLAENAALEIQMASIGIDPENENDGSPELSVQADQEDASPQHHRSIPTSPQVGHGHELYDPFLMDKEYEQRLLGDTRVVQMDDSRSYDPPLKDRSVTLCGEDLDPVLCVEVQVHRQAEVNDEEPGVYGAGVADGCEHPLEKILPHDGKIEHRTPSPSQSEQHQHRQSGHVVRRIDKTMWICGHGLVALARRMSMWPECEIQLGCVRGLWSGKHGMTWKELMPQLVRLRNKWPSPDILIIHLGGNDINVRNTEDLLSAIKEELNLVHNIFPQCLIVWSDILPRHHWEQDMSCSGVEFDEANDRIRDLINFQVHAIVTDLGGRIITHENIGPELYHSNGIHLSDEGIQRFNQNIQEFVEKWEEEFITTPEHLEIAPNSPKPSERSVEYAKQCPDLLPCPDNSKESRSVASSLPSTSFHLHSPPASSTVPDVSPDSLPATPHSGPSIPVENGACSLNPTDLDATTEDSGHTIISHQQSQKNVKTTETVCRPHKSPVLSSASVVSTNICPSAVGGTPAVSEGATMSLQNSQRNELSTNNSSGLQNPPSTSTRKCMKRQTYKTVWMCGYSLANLARRLATSPMGFMKQGKKGAGVWVHHWGKPGMPWKDLMLEMPQCNDTPGPHPDMLLIHLGGNPNYMGSVKNLLKNIKKDLIQAHNSFPRCLIVWSDMLLMRFSKGAPPHVKLGEAGERIHEVINRKVHNIIALLGGRVITHENIGTELYTASGNDMVISKQGMQRFKQNIEQFLNRWKKEANTASKDMELPPKSSEPIDHLKSDHLDQTQMTEDSGNTVISKEIITDCETMATADQDGNSTSENMKTVWICGDSLVTLVSQRMLFPTYSINQNGTMVCSYWMGHNLTMSWRMLVSQLTHLKLNFPSPDMIIIHMKDVHMNEKNKEHLLNSIKNTLTSIHKSFPQCLIVWSDMLPKYSRMKGTMPRKVVDTLHDLINKRTHAMVARLGGTFVTHKNIGPELYRCKGHALTANGVETFKTNIKDFVDEWVKDITHTEAESPGISSPTIKVRGSNRRPITGHVDDKNIKTVWICGNADVELAKKMTLSTNNGIRLDKLLPGMRVHWTGQLGLDWRKLEAHLKQEWPLPDLLITHMGDGNSTMAFAEQMLKSIREFFPQCLIVWSDVLSRHNGKQATALEVTNDRAHAVVTKLGGRIITHENIGPEEFCNNGKFMTAEGILRFCQNIQRFLEGWKSELGSLCSDAEQLSESPGPRDTLVPASLADHITLSDNLTRRNAHPLNPVDLEETPKDLGNANISPEPTQKDAPSTVNTSLAQLSSTSTSTQKMKAYRTVWMCGYALSGLAKRMAAAQSHSISPPSLILHHLGGPGMAWSDLVGQLHNFKCKQSHPDMLIIHLVASNISTTKKEDLLKAIKKDLTDIHRIFPQCLIVWSDMLLMRYSQQDKAPGEMYEVINRTAHAVVTALGGRVITHGNIGPELYRPNGNDMVLSGGIQSFNMNIQRFVEDWKKKIKPLSEDTGTIEESSGSANNAPESVPQLCNSVSNSSNLAKNMPQPHGLRSTSTAADVSPCSPAAPAPSSHSYSGPSRPADGDVPPPSRPADGNVPPPLRSAGDATPGDSGNGIVSPQQSQKNAKASETISPSPPVITSVPDVPSNPCCAEQQQQVPENNERPVEVEHTHGNNETSTGSVPKTLEQTSPPKMLWMCGFALSDLPKRILAERASTSGDKNPPMRFRQWGDPKVSWSKLTSKMSSFKCNANSRPDMFIVHLGNRNINLKCAEFWLKAIEKDLGRTHRNFPQCLIVWSNMLARCSWTKGMSNKTAIRATDMFNRRAGAMVTELGGRVISHDNIGPDLFQHNGFQVVPTQQGMRMFKQNILRFVEEWERGLSVRAELTHPPTASPGLTASSTGPAGQTHDPLSRSDTSTKDASTTCGTPSSSSSSSSSSSTTTTPPAAAKETKATTEVSRNATISPQQTQKDMKATEPRNQTQRRPVTSSAPESSPSPCPVMSSAAKASPGSRGAAGGERDGTPAGAGSSAASQKASLPAVSKPPESKDSSSSTVKQNVSLEASVKSLCTRTRRQEGARVEKLSPKSSAVPANRAVTNVPNTKEELLKYYRLFTLNPNTAHRNLCLSENNRKVEWREEAQPYPYHPQRFVDKCYQVLCWESVSERRYFEVEWSGSVCISLSFENKRCQKQVSVCFGANSQSWTLQLSPSGCFYCHNGKKTKLPQVRGSRVGVYVDYKAHTLGFYSLSDSPALLCKVQTKFAFPVHPGFGLSPGSSVKLL